METISWAINGLCKDEMVKNDSDLMTLYVTDDFPSLIIVGYMTNKTLDIARCRAISYNRDGQKFQPAVYKVMGTEDLIHLACSGYSLKSTLQESPHDRLALQCFTEDDCFWYLWFRDE